MRSVVLALSAVLVTGMLSGCTGHCANLSAQWTEPAIFAAVGPTAAQEFPAGPGLPASGSWIHGRWPDATIESITWLPTAARGRFEEPGNGGNFRPEPMIQMFSSRENYGIRPGWPHSYEYGPRIAIPPDPFLVVVVTEPQTPVDLVHEVTQFLDHLGIPSESHQGILTHLETHKERHTGVHNASTGRDTWKYGYWAPITDLPPMNRLIEQLDREPRIEARFVGWTDVIFDPHWKITLDQPVRRLQVESSIGTISLEVDGSDTVHAASSGKDVEDESALRNILQDAFEQAGLPATRIAEAKIDLRNECS